MSRQTTLRLLAVVLCFVSITNTTHATATACPQPACTYLPFVAIAQPIEVTGYVIALFGGGTQPTYIAVRGQVINRSNEPILDARVRVSGVDGFGNFVSQTVPLALPVTFPSQLNPFEAVYSQYGGYPTRPQFDIIVGSTNGAYSYEPVTVVTSRTVSNGDIEVTFRNDASVPIQDVQAVLGLINPPNSQTTIVYPRVYPPYSVASFIAPSATVTYTFPVALAPGGPQQWFVVSQGSTCFTSPIFCP